MNAPFEAIEELRLVLGVSAALYRRVAGLVTVHSRRPWVNLATAPADVLLALPGFDEAGRERVLENRTEMEEAAGAPVPPLAISPTRFGRVVPPGRAGS